MSSRPSSRAATARPVTARPVTPRPLRWRVGRLASVALLLLVGVAQANQSRITWFTQEARRLAKADGAAEIAQAFGTLRAWIAEAQARQVARDTDGVARSLERIEAQHALIVALLDKVVAARRAADARSEATDARKAATQAHLTTAEREEVRRRIEIKVDPRP